jgi:hypothetical protein
MLSDLPCQSKGKRAAESFAAINLAIAWIACLLVGIGDALFCQVTGGQMESAVARRHAGPTQQAHGS